MKKYFVAVVALIFSTTLAFAGGQQNQRTDAQNLAQLSEEQKATIYGVYEEEKVARDVYITLGELYPEENTFANIQLSEQTHMDAVRNLCDTYGIYIPEGDQPVGEFSLEAMEVLYGDFVAAGNDSILSAALKVGKDIETMDIDDLSGALEGMPRDVQKVFLNLINGSDNHLDAFTIAYDREIAQ